MGASATAQVWYPAANPDYSAAGQGAVEVENTGNDHAPLADKTLRVMCWDGQKPGFGWSFGSGDTPDNDGFKELLGVHYGSVTDPDIVADPGNFGTRPGERTDVLAVYLLNGAVHYEVQTYDIGTNDMSPVTSAPVRLSGREAHNPNVDVDGDGHAIITWEEGGYIFAQAYDMDTRTLYHRCEVAGTPYVRCRQPDVAVGYVPGPDGPVVSFIFIVDDPRQGSSVNIVQDTRTHVTNTPSINTGVGTEVLPYVRSEFEYPRIAAPANWSVYGPYDFEAVVAAASTNEIYGLNYFQAPNYVSAAALPTATVLNYDGALNRLAQCSRPVVSYCFDMIEVAWTLSDRTMGNVVRNGNQEILQRNLRANGTIYTAAQIYGPGYDIVNRVEDGNQRVPSVAGRHAAFVNSNSVTAKALYTFHDEERRDILYKSGYFIDVYLRPATAAQPVITAYPNPFQNETTLQLALAPGETVQSLEVLDPLGAPVHQQPARLLKQGAKQVRWDATGLRPGLYLVRLRTSTGASYTYRVQHN